MIRALLDYLDGDGGGVWFAASLLIALFLVLTYEREAGR